MAKATGRPLKYREFIEILDNDVVYSPASIVNHAVEQGLRNPDEDMELFRKERVKIRHTLARFVKNHNFPVEGDGTVAIAGQPLSRGWYGSRWKDALPPQRKQKPKEKEEEPGCDMQLHTDQLASQPVETLL